MGMDVSGKNPSSAEGKYFRANVWSWRPLCALIQLSGYNVPEAWEYNDGAGCKNQAEASLLADKLENFLKECGDDDLELPAPNSALVDERGRFGVGGKLSPYKIQREHAKAFVRFLRACGGFEIW